MKTEDREFVRVYVLDYLQQHYPEVAAHGGAAEIKRVMREAIEALTLELAMAEAALDADHNHEGG